MSINKKISKMPVWVLLLILVYFLIQDFGLTRLSLKASSNVFEGNPLHRYFVGLIGPDYFLYMFPIALIIIILGVIYGGKLVSRFEKNMPGQQVVAIFVILIWLPNILHQIISFSGFRYKLHRMIEFLVGMPLSDWTVKKGIIVLGVILAIIFMILVEYDNYKLKKKK